MKALEKDRSRRYETATGLAKDVRRYLDGDPVEAGPPSARYRLGKFARKHRAALATAGAFAAILFLAALVGGYLAVRARSVEALALRAERRRADQRGDVKAEARATERSGSRSGPAIDAALKRFLVDVIRASPELKNNLKVVDWLMWEPSPGSTGRPRGRPRSAALCSMRWRRPTSAWASRTGRTRERRPRTRSKGCARPRPPRDSAQPRAPTTPGNITSRGPGIRRLGRRRGPRRSTTNEQESLKLRTGWRLVRGAPRRSNGFPGRTRWSLSSALGAGSPRGSRF